MAKDIRYMRSGMPSFILWLIYLIMGFIEILIGLRIILKLFGANASASFVHWVYETSSPLLQPFIGAFPAPVIDGRYVIEFSAMFALIVYALIAYLISQLIYYLTAREIDRG